MAKLNEHNTRESWLRGATALLRPYFSKLGYQLPEKIRYSIAFTSGGKRATMGGECWHPENSGDQHFEIIIKADRSDPIEVLGILVHNLVHTLLSADAKHGPEFKDIALRIGLEGPMRHAMPGPVLRERLNSLAPELGPLPHARLDFTLGPDVEKKQTTRMLKAECGGGCGYTIRLSSKWAKIGLPICPVSDEHGALICEDPIEDDNSFVQELESDEAFKQNLVVENSEKKVALNALNLEAIKKEVLNSEMRGQG